MANYISKTSLVTTYFDQVYVINLDRREDRKIFMLQKLNRQGIKAVFVSAYDGHDNHIKSSYLKYLAKPLSHPLELANSAKMIKSEGALAYLETYKYIINHASINNYQRILCFDDDIIFHKNFESNFVQFITQIRSDWKLLYFGASQHNKSVNARIFHNNKPYYTPVLTDGSFAIGLHSSIYPLLLEQIEKQNCSFDSGPLRHICNLFPKKCFVALPNLVIADVTESDILVERDMHQMAQIFQWELKQYYYPHKPDLISVIMPAYNASNTIEHSTASILNQSYQNIELIIVDDASSDNTQSKLKKIALSDSRVKIVRHRNNQGCYVSRNNALKEVESNIVTIQDADDIAHPDRILKQQIPILTGNALFSLANIIRSDELISKISTNWQSIVTSDNYKSQLGFNTAMYHISLFNKYGVFREERFAADMEFFERILLTEKLFDPRHNTLNVHQLLDYISTIPHFYNKIDKVLVISERMTKTNITNIYSKHQLRELQVKWRLDYGNIKYETLKTTYNFYNNYGNLNPLASSITPSVPIIGTTNSHNKILLEQLNIHKNELNAMKQSLSWKITQPLRALYDIILHNKI